MWKMALRVIQKGLKKMMSLSTLRHHQKFWFLMNASVRLSRVPRLEGGADQSRLMRRRQIFGIG
jgi:hypothetical protein